MISVKNLRKSFHGLEVLKGISTEIHKGDVVCVIGPSGSGKSTFLRCLNMLEKPDDGKIIFSGEDLAAPKANLNLHRQKMGMVFQQFNLFPHMTVLENLTCAPITLKKIPKAEAEARPWSCWAVLVWLTGQTNTPTSSPADRSSVWPLSVPCAWIPK